MGTEFAPVGIVKNRQKGGGTTTGRVGGGEGVGNVPQRRYGHQSDLQIRSP